MTDPSVSDFKLFVSGLAGLAFIVALIVGGWQFLASDYRERHCIQLFGHWIDNSHARDNWLRRPSPAPTPFCE